MRGYTRSAGVLLLFGLFVLRSEILKLTIALSREVARAMGTASNANLLDIAWLCIQWS